MRAGAASSARRGRPGRWAEALRTMRGRVREVEFGPVNGVYRSAEPEPAGEGMVEPLPAPTGLRTAVHVYTPRGRTRTLVWPALGRYVDVWS